MDYPVFSIRISFIVSKHRKKRKKDVSIGINTNIREYEPNDVSTKSIRDRCY